MSINTSLRLSSLRLALDNIIESKESVLPITYLAPGSFDTIGRSERRPCHSNHRQSTDRRRQSRNIPHDRRRRPGPPDTTPTDRKNPSRVSPVPNGLFDVAAPLGLIETKHARNLDRRRSLYNTRRSLYNTTKSNWCLCTVTFIIWFGLPWKNFTPPSHSLKSWKAAL